MTKCLCLIALLGARKCKYKSNSRILQLGRRNSCVLQNEYGFAWRDAFLLMPCRKVEKLAPIEVKLSAETRLGRTSPEVRKQRSTSL
jgi:hypothetical protein